MSRTRIFEWWGLTTVLLAVGVCVSLAISAGRLGLQMWSFALIALVLLLVGGTLVRSVEFDDTGIVLRRGFGSRRQGYPDAALKRIVIHGTSNRLSANRLLGSRPRVVLEFADQTRVWFGSSAGGSSEFVEEARRRGVDIQEK